MKYGRIKLHVTVNTLKNESISKKEKYHFIIAMQYSYIFIK